jgi:CRP-like cAMP-binding protein
MKNSALLTYLNQTLCTNEPALNLILAHNAKRINYLKNEVIEAKGKIPLQLSFIEEGIAIALSHARPNRKVMRFWTANQFICPIGFFTNQPCTHSIVALEDCRISALNYRELLTFLADFPEGYGVINKILQAEINSVALNIKSLTQNKTRIEHESFLQALSISFDE